MKDRIERMNAETSRCPESEFILGSETNIEVDSPS
jgi:hypothetical protein